MGNAVGSVASGIGGVFGNILGHPLDFLSGKACNLCAPTWDFLCYIENFCVSQLFKFAMVAILVYFVLLFFYLLFNLGIFQCICRTLCHIMHAFFSTYLSAIRCCCSYCDSKLRSIRRRRKLRRQRRRLDIEESAGSSGSEEDGYELGEMPTFQQPRNVEHGRSQFGRRKNYRDEHLRRSLRPNSHRTRVELSGNSGDLGRRKGSKNVDDHVRVTRSSKFSHKGSRHRGRTQHRR